MRELPRGRPARPGRGLLPAARPDLRRVPSRPAARLPLGRGDLQPLRLLLVVQRLVGRSRQALRRRCRGEAGTRSRLLRRRGREQRRLPAAARRRAGHPVPGRRAGRQRRRGRHREGHPHRGGVPRRGDGQQDPGRARAGRPRRREQRLRPRPRHRRLRQGPARARRRHRSGHDRDPAPAAAHRGQRVRHDLPRALLLPVPAHDPAGAGRRRPHGGRRRGAREPRRLAADVVGTHRARARALTRGRASARDRGRRGPRHRPGARRLRRTGGDGAQRPARVPHRLLTTGRDRRRLRRTGQGEHPPQPLRHPLGPRALLGRQEPVQARQVPPGHAHPDPPGRGAGPGPPRLRPHHAVEPA